MSAHLCRVIIRQTPGSHASDRLSITPFASALHRDGLRRTVPRDYDPVYGPQSRESFAYPDTIGHSGGPLGVTSVVKDACLRGCCAENRGVKA